MKNKRSFICLMILITSIVISCSWQIPENVKVKTKADYNFGLGNVKTDLTSQLDIPKMIKDQGVELPLGMTIQDYFPGKKDSDTQRYLVRIPIIEMPLDIEQYLKQLDMITKMDPIEIEEVKFKVPDITDILKDPIKVDIPLDTVIPYINQGVKGAGFVNNSFVDLYPAKILDTIGVKIGKVTYGANSQLIIQGEDIKATVEGFGGSLPTLPDGAGDYEFSPTIANGRKVTIDFGVNPANPKEHIIKEQTVTDNKAVFDISNMTLDVSNIQIKFDAGPYVKLVDDTASRFIQSRGFPDGFDIPNLDFGKLPIPPEVEGLIENPPTKEQLQKDPQSIINKVPIEGINKDMTPQEIAQKVQAKKPVLVVEGYTANISETSTLKKIEGFSILDKSADPVVPREIKADIPGQNVQNMFPDETGVIQAEIGKGNIGIKLEGLTADYNMEVKSEGGLTINQTISKKKTDTTDPSLDLAGTKIKKGESTITGKATIILDDTTIVFDPKPQLVVTPVLETVKSATVDINAFGDNINNMLKFEDSFPLPKEIAQFVNGITLENSGVSITYTNNLPKNNDIKFKAKSNFLKIDRTKENVPETDPNSVVVIHTGVTDKKEDLFISDTINLKGVKDPAVDFSVEVILPKAEGDKDSWVTVQNIEFGKEYSIKFKLTPIINWTSINVNTSNIPIPKETINTNLNLYDQLQDIAKQINQPDVFERLSLTDLPIYIFCTKPQGIDVLDSMEIKAKAELFFGKENPDKTITHVENSPVGKLIYDKTDPNGFDTITFVDSLPKLKTESFIYDAKTGSKVESVITDLSALPPNEVSLKPDSNELNNIIKGLMSTNGSLCLEYDVQINNTNGQPEVTIRKDQLMSSTNSKIALEAYIDLGLAFNLTGIIPDGQTEPSGVGMAIDVIQLANLQDSLKEDLLQGQIAELKKQGIDKVMKAIKEISVSYHVNALPLSLDTKQDLAIKIGLNDDIEKTVGLQKGTIGIVNADIDKVLAKEKLIVNKIQVLVPAGTFSIKRAKNVELGLDVKLATDGTIEVMKDGKLTFGGAK